MSSGSRPPDRRSGANALVTSAGEAGFLAFEAIVCLAGFHLKFLAFKSLMLATEINETSKKWHQRIQISIIRLSPRSLTICSLPEKSIENIEGMDLNSNISKLIVIAALHFAFLSRVNKQEDKDWMKSERLTAKTLRYNTSFQFRPHCIRLFKGDEM